MAKDALVTVVQVLNHIQDDPIEPVKVRLERIVQQQDERNEYMKARSDKLQRWKTNDRLLEVSEIENQFDAAMSDILTRLETALSVKAPEIQPIDQLRLKMQTQRCSDDIQQRLELQRQERLKREEVERQAREMEQVEKKKKAAESRRQADTIRYRWAYIVDKLLCLSEEGEKLIVQPSLARPSTTIASIMRSIAQTFVDACFDQGKTKAMTGILMGREARTEDNHQEQHQNFKIIRLGMLLLRNSSEKRYGSMYKKMFRRVGRMIGIDIHWTVFVSWRNVFPTKAQIRYLTGLVVCGGPGWEEYVDKSALYHQNMMRMLRDLVATDSPVFLAGLGAGHIYIGDALGGTIKHLGSGTQAIHGAQYFHGQQVTHLSGVSFEKEHGEYGSFISKISTETVLSFAAYPESLGVLLKVLSSDTSSAITKPRATVHEADRMISQLLQYFKHAKEYREFQGMPCQMQTIFPYSSLQRVSPQKEPEAIQLNIVFTKDRHPIVFDNAGLLSGSDIKLRQNFATRKRMKFNSSKKSETDYWVEDFTLDEIKTMRKSSRKGSKTASRIPSLLDAVKLVSEYSRERQMVMPLQLCFPEEEHDWFKYSTEDLSIRFSQIMAALTVTNYQGDVMIQSYAGDLLISWRKMKPEWSYILYLTLKNSRTYLPTYDDTSIDFIAKCVDGIAISSDLVRQLNHSRVTTSVIQKCKSHGLKVIVSHPDTSDWLFYGGVTLLADQPEVMYYAIPWAMGADAVYCRFPLKSIDALEQLSIGGNVQTVAKQVVRALSLGLGPRHKPGASKFNPRLSLVLAPHVNEDLLHQEMARQIHSHSLAGGLITTRKNRPKIQTRNALKEDETTHPETVSDSNNMVLFQPTKPKSKRRRRANRPTRSKCLIKPLISQANAPPTRPFNKWTSTFKIQI